jgi:hypothetical protein
VLPRGARSRPGHWCTDLAAESDWSSDYEHQRCTQSYPACAKAIFLAPWSSCQRLLACEPIKAAAMTRSANCEPVGSVRTEWIVAFVAHRTT